MQAGGRRFDPVRLHQFFWWSGRGRRSPKRLTSHPNHGKSNIRFQERLSGVIVAGFASESRQADRRVLFVIVNMMLSELHSSACYPA